ncbi:hypothetical protein [Streptomyces sp. NPDC016845]|uniref:hypothetical protein n=1 Tax=Streptomyces sp. NPDC016845 TaxID=3364972 RepID=UPI00379DA21F
MDHADTAVESELVDLGGWTLEQLRAHTGAERALGKRRLLRKLDDPDVNFGGDDGS